MKALITGGSGFVGSHLAEALLARGDSVLVLDNLSTGSIANIAHLKKHPNFAYVIDDVMNRRALAEAVDDCDVIYHLAAAVGVRLVVESPVRTIETNLEGTKVVFALGYSHPVVFKIPEGIKVAIDKQTRIVVSGIDRQQVGQVAAEIRSLRKPDPYKQKGIRYVGEILKKKAGKAGATGGAK